ncbi:MAG: bifunctional nuclease family protein [Saprospiraceae bacterium]|nr:bifunctional nuclease family protein [Saprospiraceae bacterium]
MDKIELSIDALAQNEAQNNSFVVILKEEGGDRRLPVVIGGFEAQAIAIAVEGIQPNRPMTHDLFRNTLSELGVDLVEIIISKLSQGIFYASLVCKQIDGSVLQLDSRTSDAIALAVRFGCPIFTVAEVMDKAGIQWGQEEEKKEKEIPKDQPLTSYSEEDLRKLLDEALETENYERAAEIRDELKRRGGDN